MSSVVVRSLDMKPRNGGGVQKANDVDEPSDEFQKRIDIKVLKEFGDQALADSENKQNVKNRKSEIIYVYAWRGEEAWKRLSYGYDRRPRGYRPPLKALA
ncbi:hypothetical protein CVT24_003586 [Panaeolus cyanescens]|uniref:Uncharacterized protein n=1 Tax=Panaeolus cyanescens TaxID=181874 RepID=A0A409X3Y5_9AGAR|nr:hypothetical protein CVT24_003586 [Panaeolus cyanescens]